MKRRIIKGISLLTAIIFIGSNIAFPAPEYFKSSRGYLRQLANLERGPALPPGITYNRDYLLDHFDQYFNNGELIPQAQRTALVDELLSVLRRENADSKTFFEKWRGKVQTRKTSSPVAKREKVKLELPQTDDISTPEKRAPHRGKGLNGVFSTLFIYAVAGAGTRLKNSMPEDEAEATEREGVLNKNIIPSDRLSLDSPIGMHLKSLARLAEEAGAKDGEVDVVLVISPETEKGLRMTLERNRRYLRTLNIMLVQQGSLPTMNEKGQMVTVYNQKSGKWELYPSPSGTFGIFQALEKNIRNEDLARLGELGRRPQGGNTFMHLAKENGKERVTLLYGDEMRLRSELYASILGVAMENEQQNPGSITVIGMDKKNPISPPGGTWAQKVKVLPDGTVEVYFNAYELKERTYQLQLAELEALGKTGYFFPFNTGNLITPLSRVEEALALYHAGIFPVHIAFKDEYLFVRLSDGNIIKLPVKGRKLEWFAPEITFQGSSDMPAEVNGVKVNAPVVKIAKVGERDYGALKDYPAKNKVLEWIYEESRETLREMGVLIDDTAVVRLGPRATKDRIAIGEGVNVGPEVNLYLEDEVKIGNRVKFSCKGVLRIEGPVIIEDDVEFLGEGEINIINENPGVPLVIKKGTKIICQSREKIKEGQLGVREAVLIKNSISGTLDTAACDLTPGGPSWNDVKRYLWFPFENTVLVTTVETDAAGNIKKAQRQWALGREPAANEPNPIEVFMNEYIVKPAANEKRIFNILFNLYKQDTSAEKVSYKEALKKATAVINAIPDADKRARLQAAFTNLEALITIAGFFVQAQGHSFVDGKTLDDVELEIAERFIADIKLDTGEVTASTLELRDEILMSPILMNALTTLLSPGNPVTVEGFLAPFREAAATTGFNLAKPLLFNNIAALMSDNFKRILAVCGNDRSEAYKFIREQMRRTGKSFANVVIGKYIDQPAVELKKDLEPMMNPRDWVQSFSGLRGKWGDVAQIKQAGAAMASLYAYAYGLERIKDLESFGKKKLIFAIGRDTRKMNEAIRDAQIRGLLAAGKEKGVEIEIIDLGYMTTPTWEAAIRGMGLDGGVMISASHTPYNYIGWKDASANEEKTGELVSQGALLTAERMAGIITHFMSLINDVKKGDYGVLEKINDVDITALYRSKEAVEGNRQKAIGLFVEFIWRQLGIDPADEPAKEKFRGLMNGMEIGVDFSGGGACGIYDAVLKEFGLKPVGVNIKHGEHFHSPEPTGDAFEQLIVLMDKFSLAIGGLTDLDADRATLAARSSSAFKNKIMFLSQQQVAAMNVAMWLSREQVDGNMRIERDSQGKPTAYDKQGRKVAIVVHDPTSSMAWDVARTFGVEIFECEVGEIIVYQKMRELEAEGYYVPIGIEGANGGTLFGKDTCRNGLFTILFAALIQKDPRMYENWLAMRKAYLEGLTKTPYIESELKKINEETQRFGVAGEYSLWEIAESLPFYSSRDDVKLEGLDVLPQGLVKDIFEEKFMELWKNKNLHGGLEDKCGLWEQNRHYVRYEFVNYEEARTPGDKRTGDESGGWKVRLYDNQGNVSWLWLRYSKTEPSEARIITDSISDDEAVELMNLGQVFYSGGKWGRFETKGADSEVKALIAMVADLRGELEVDKVRLECIDPNIIAPEDAQRLLRNLRDLKISGNIEKGMLKSLPIKDALKWLCDYTQTARIQGLSTIPLSFAAPAAHPALEAMKYQIGALQNI